MLCIGCSVQQPLQVWYCSGCGSLPLCAKRPRGTGCRSFCIYKKQALGKGAEDRAASAAKQNQFYYTRLWRILQMEITIRIEDRSLAVLDKLAGALQTWAQREVSVPAECKGTETAKNPPEPNLAVSEKPAAPVMNIEELRSRVTDFCKADMKVNPGKIQNFFNSLGVESLPQVPAEKYADLLKIMEVA